MATPTVNVTATITDQSSTPVQNAVVTVVLDRSEPTSLGYVVPLFQKFTTDVNGQVVMPLWPNALGSVSSVYRVHAIDPTTGQTLVDVSATIPNNDCTLSAVAYLPAYPGKPEGWQAADSANTSASAAATSETNAASSASAASTSETNAASSASAASTSETNAASSAANASTSEGNALSYLHSFENQYYGSSSSDPTTNPNGGAMVVGDLYFNSTTNTLHQYTGSTWVDNTTTASTAATNASNSASAASTSETNAATSATNASNSASAASTSETNAATSASNASTSETNAATSATNASTSETNALNSWQDFQGVYYGSYAADPTTDPLGNAMVAGSLYFNTGTGTLHEYNGTAWVDNTTTASTAATNASNSASAASTSETNAATSATNASNSASAASTSETNAASSASSAASSYTSFHNIYYGAYATAPTTRPDSSAIQSGDLYYDTATPGLMTYSGSAWTTVSTLTQSQTDALYVALSSVGAASGVASLNASSLVVQNPASTGAANGIATLDSGGNVPAAQLGNAPSAPVSSVFGRTGAVTLQSSDVTGALGYTPAKTDAGANGVGSFALLKNVSGSTVAKGGTAAGSSLYGLYISSSTTWSVTLGTNRSGTWRAMEAVANLYVTIFQRIA